MRLSNALACRAAVIAFATGIVVAATAIPALAAAPANDSYADRVVIGALPFSATLDTSEATSDAITAELNGGCGAPATDASIWYEVTAGSDGGMVVDVFGSNYSAGVIVAEGGPGAWAGAGCGPGSVAWPTTAGTTYTIVVFDDQQDGGGNGGTASITVDVIPPPPSMDIIVNPRAQFTRSGTAVVSGTLLCNGPANAWLEVYLSQRVGRGVVRGFSSTGGVACDGTTQPWSAEIRPDADGKFAGGKAASVTFGYACGRFECAYEYLERAVHLSRAS